MLKIRKSEDRAYLEHGWLKSYRSFTLNESFGVGQAGYSVLKALNEEEIQAGMGFGMQSHHDVEIVTYVLSGQLNYNDNVGNQFVAIRGDVQRLTAGSAVRHSEYNLSGSPVHLLQLSISPSKKGLPPSCERKHFSTESKENKWCLIVSSSGQEEALSINQDIALQACLLTQGSSIEMQVCESRGHYLHLAKGEAVCNGILLEAGDALTIEHETSVNIVTATGAELLWLDLPLVE